jgi:hypothetical protein
MWCYLAAAGSWPTAPPPPATPRDSSKQQVGRDWSARGRRCVFAQQSNRQLLLQLMDNDEQTLNVTKYVRISGLEGTGTCDRMVAAVANVVLNRPQPSGEKF